MSRQTEIEDYEYTITKFETLVETRNRLQRLIANLDFKAIINDLYMVKEAASFVALAGDPNMKPEQRQDAMQMAMAPGHLKRWLSVQIQMGNKAEDDIKVAKQHLDVLRAISDEQFDSKNYSFDSDTEE